MTAKSIVSSGIIHQLMRKIRVAGIQKQSLIDYPGKVACVIFLAGCDLRCHYCHNSQLLDPSANQFDFDAILDYVRANQTMLDAVVVSGGEPTQNPDLLTILQALCEFNLSVKLDTNGMHPAVVKYVVEAGLVDYVALDVKATVEKYPIITGAAINPVIECLQYLRAQTKISYMLRTTLTPWLEAKDLLAMGKTLINGAPLWQIQQCRVAGAYSPQKVQKMAKLVEKYAQHIVVVGL